MAKTTKVQEVFLTREQVMRWGQFHAYTLNRLRREDPTFPKPMNFGERQLRWSLTELEKWAQHRAMQTRFVNEETGESHPAPKKAEWIYLPGRTKTCEGDRTSWIMKTGNTITVSVKGEISDAYRKDLQAFCEAHGVEVPQDGERVSFRAFTAVEIAFFYLDKGLKPREIIHILQDTKRLRADGFTKSEDATIHDALNIVLSKAGESSLGNKRIRIE